MAVSRRDRIMAILFSSALGGVASMLALKFFHEWAFRTEYWFYVGMTAVHSCLVFILFAFWFGIIRPSIPRTNSVLQCIAAAAVGGILPIFIPWGFILVMMGQAFITSGVAALVYTLSSLAYER